MKIVMKADVFGLRHTRSTLNEVDECFADIRFANGSIWDATACISIPKQCWDTLELGTELNVTMETFAKPAQKKDA
jgi:hypothetical protein